MAHKFTELECYLVRLSVEMAALCLISRHLCQLSSLRHELQRSWLSLMLVSQQYILNHFQKETQGLV